MASYYHCLATRSTADIGNKGFIGKTVYKAQCLQRRFRTARALSFHIGEKSQIKLSSKSWIVLFSLLIFLLYLHIRKVSQYLQHNMRIKLEL